LAEALACGVNILVAVILLRIKWEWGKMYLFSHNIFKLFDILELDLLLGISKTPVLQPAESAS
jgi:hypothetical protein